MISGGCSGGGGSIAGGMGRPPGSGSAGGCGGMMPGTDGVCGTLGRGNGIVIGNSWLLVDDEPLHQIANGVPAQGI